MTQLAPARSTAPRTTAATNTAADRFAEVMAFADAQRMRKAYPPGWFEEVETELRQPQLDGDPPRSVRLLRALEVPASTGSIAVSLDGVLAPIDGGNRPVDVRNAAAREGRQSKGPAALDHLRSRFAAPGRDPPVRRVLS